MLTKVEPGKHQIRATRGDDDDGLYVDVHFAHPETLPSGARPMADYSLTLARLE